MKTFVPKNRAKVVGASALLFLMILFAVFSQNALAQSAPASPHIPAFLPKIHDVPPTKSLPIDGVWRVNTIGKRIRIDDGRAYAVDPWLHMLVLHVQPEMVVIQNIKRTGWGEYGGDDLPLMGKLAAKLDDSGVLNVKVASVLGPIQYQLLPVSMDDPAGIQRELARAPAPAPTPPPRPAPQPRPTPKPRRNDITPGCGGPGESPCTAILPRHKGKARKLGCPGKNNYFAALRGGSCWTCPSGYKRTLRKMDHPRACKKRKSLKGPWTRATYKGRAWGCPSGQFHAGAPTGGDCFSCPRGYKRVHVAGMDQMRCIPENRCDAGLRVAKQPPTKDIFASLFGAAKAKVCAPPFDIAAAAKRDLPKFEVVRIMVLPPAKN